MLFLIKMALRNMSRQKRRNIFTALVITIALFIYLVFDSIMVGMDKTSFENIIDFETGHIQVTHQQFWEEKDELPLDYLISWEENLKQNIEEIEKVQSISPELRFSATLNNGVNEIPVIGLGVNPQQYEQVFQTTDYIIEGEMFASGEYQVLLGKDLADLMQLGVGDYMTLLVKTKEGTFNTIDATISGLMITPHPMVNNSTVLVPLDIAQQALNAENEITQIVLRNGQREKSPKVATEITQQLQQQNASLRAYPWQEAAASVVGVSQMKRKGNRVILGIILLIAAVGILNTVVLSSLERTEEIGMMKAMGMKEGEIVTVFVAEATGIGILGSIAGCLLGAIGVGILANVGIDTSLWGDMSDYNIPILGKLYSSWNPSAFVFMFAFSVLIAMIASFWPAYTAARKDPVKAIYYR